jgi:ABC-type Na+ efflux pump permease subunit
MINDFIVVFSAEFVRRIKSRPFQIGLILGVFGILAIVRLPLLMTQDFIGAGTRIVLAGDPSIVSRARPLLEKDYVVVAIQNGSRAPSAADLAAHKASSWVTLERAPSAGLRFTLYSNNPKNVTADTLSADLTSLNISLATAIPRERIHALLRVPHTVVGVGSKFATGADAEVASGIGYGLLVLLYVLILLNSQLVMASVAEEKTSRIAELLVASISPIPLLYGKIAATTAIGLLQMAVWIAAGALFAGSGGAPIAAGAPSRAMDFGPIFSGAITPAEIVAFIALFALGFLQYSLLFAGVASLINRTEDLGSVAGPINLPVVGGFIIAIAALSLPDAPWAVAASFIPLIAPFVLFARIATSNVPAWQIAGSLIINVAAIWLIAVIAGKLYRVGMLLYGRPPSLAQIWSVIRS